MRRAMASTIELEILPDLNFLLAPILAIAKIATMVGLLGTVISMINTFSAISAGDDGRRRGVALSGDRPGSLRDGVRAGHRHSARLFARALQGLDRPVRTENAKSAVQKFLVLMQNQKVQRPVTASRRRPNGHRPGYPMPSNSRLRHLVDGHEPRLSRRAVRRRHRLAATGAGAARRPRATRGGGEWQVVSESAGLRAVPAAREVAGSGRCRRGDGAGGRLAADPPQVGRRRRRGHDPADRHQPGAAHLLHDDGDGGGRRLEDRYAADATRRRIARKTS